MSRIEWERANRNERGYLENKTRTMAADRKETIRNQKVEKSHTFFVFGKYKNKTINSVISSDPGYIHYLLSNSWFVKHYHASYMTIIKTINIILSEPPKPKKIDKTVKVYSAEEIKAYEESTTYSDEK